MSITQQQADWFSQTLDRIIDNIEGAVLGKRNVVKLVVTCLLSEGHMLIEDYPGTGKTQLARALANTVQGSHSRIQFTPDLLPSDVTGVTVYDQAKGTFEFHPGPIFHSIVLADEINRASPKTQSALLEVMEEGRVTVDGEARSVGRPFMVIATQNPIEQAGTYRLPEAQLDRFLMKTSVGYPDRASTVQLLVNSAVRDRAALVEPIITSSTIAQMSELADEVYIDPAIVGYVSQIAEESRRHPHVRLGASMRGCLALVRTAKVWALADGRPHVTPDDVKDLAEPVLCHRLILDTEAQFNGVTVEQIIAELLADIAPPVERVA